MTEEMEQQRRKSEKAPLSFGQIVLTFGIIAIGTGLATYVFHVFNELLTGHSPGGSVWIALVLLVLLVGLLRIPWIWLKKRTPKKEYSEESAPVGTAFLLLVYIIVLAGMWGTLYWTLIVS